MLSKALALTSVAALAGQSFALNAHRGLHAEKRAVKVVYETVWTTLYVTTDCTSSTVQPSLSPSVDLASATSTVSATSTLTSTSTVTIASSSSSSKATSQAPPTSQQNTAQTPSSAPVVAESSSPAPSTPAAVPPPSSSTAAAPVPPSSSSSASKAPKPAPSAMAAPGGSGSKRGMAYNDPALANTFAQHCTNCQCAYNWGYDFSGLSPDIDYIPMLWSFAPEHTDGWHSAVQAALNRGSTKLLSCNEPDNSGQADLSPAAAASGHAQWMNPYAGQAQIGSPAITNSGSPGQGTDWLQQFMQACQSQAGGCAIDFCVTHWYSPVDQQQSLFDHLKKVHDICDGKPVYLTEFAPFGTNDQIAAFLQDVIPKLEALDYLLFYSYFMVNTDSLFKDASTLSEYGLTYASL